MMKHSGIVVLGVLIGGLLAGAATAETAEKIRLWPLFVYEPSEGETHVEVLGRLFTVKRSAEEDLYRFLVLSGYQRKHREKETVWDLIWPIWRIQRDDEGHFHSRFAPLFFGSDEGSRYAVLFPAFWWIASLRENGSYLVVMVPWARFRGDDDHYFNLATPLLWGRHGEHRWGAVLPIAFWDFAAEDDHTLVVFPFFHDRKDPTHSTSGMIPWWISRKGDRQFANLFPVLWQRSGKEFDAFLVLPLFYRFKETNILFPLFWDVGNTLLVLPAYGKGKFGRWQWETIVPPVYIHWGNDDYSEHDVLWPLVAWGEGEDRARRAFRPLYVYRRKRDFAQHSFLAYLGARGRGGGRKLDRFFPVFSLDRTANRRDLALFWPLYVDKKREQARARRVLCPLLPMTPKPRQPARSWEMLNLIYWGKSLQEAEKPGLARTHGFFPLYRADKGYTSGASDRLVSYRRYRFFQGLPVPLFESYIEGERYKRWKAPLELFYRERWQEPQRRRLTVGSRFMFHYRDRGDGRRNLHVLSLFWDILRPSSHSQGLWPVYTYKRNKEGGRNASFLDPLWFWGKATGEEEHVSGLFKIFDYRRKPNGDSRFSFIWRTYRRDVRGDAVSVEAFPFLSWEKSPEWSRFSFFWRVFSYDRSAGRRSLRLFFSPPIGLGGERR